MPDATLHITKATGPIPRQTPPTHTSRPPPSLCLSHGCHGSLQLIRKKGEKRWNEAGGQKIQHNESGSLTGHSGPPWLAIDLPVMWVIGSCVRQRVRRPGMHGRWKGGEWRVKRIHFRERETHREGKRKLRTKETTERNRQRKRTKPTIFWKSALQKYSSSQYTYGG